MPGEDLEIAVIGNRTDFDKAAFAFELADAFLETSTDDHAGAQPDWTPATPDELAAYAGDYEIQPGVMLSVKAEDIGLTFAFHGASREGLEPMAQIGPRNFLLNAQPLRALIFDAPIEGKSPKLAYRIGMDGKLEAPRVELKAFVPERVELGDYVARCHSDELATSYELSLVEGQLTAKHPRLPAFAVLPYQDDVFAGQGPLQKVEFARTQNGAITGFYASAPLAEHIWFTCASQK